MRRLDKSARSCHEWCSMGFSKTNVDSHARRESSVDVCVLSCRVLVLNASWTAITTTTVRHAISLACTGAARIIEPESYTVHAFDEWAAQPHSDDEAVIHTVSMRIRAPQVVLLSQYGGLPVRSVAFSRRNLLRRDEGMCQYCGKRPDVRELTIDHIVPRSRGGDTSWQNCVIACVTCNRRKGNRAPEDVGLSLRSSPGEPDWAPALDAPPQRLRDVWRRFVNKQHWARLFDLDETAA